MQKRPERDHTGGSAEPRDGRVSQATAADLALIAQRFADIEKARAEVVGALARVRARGDGEAAVGMPVEQHLAWTTRQRSGTVNGFATVVDVIGDLPGVRAALDDGQASFEQVKAVAYALIRRTRDERAVVDTVLQDSEWTHWDPDAIEFEIGRILDASSDPTVADDRAEQRRRQQWLRLQPTLDGQGLDGRFRFWDLDAATVDAVLNAAAGRPTTDDGAGPVRRQRSLAQGLLDVLLFWQAWATGRGDGDTLGGGPELPRTTAAQIYVVVDQDQATEAVAGTVWSNVPGFTPRLTANQVASLNGQTTIVLADGDAPVAIAGRPGHAATDPDGLSWDSLTILARVRDGKCRTPGCHAPARWTEIHHLVHREDGGPDRMDNLLAVCRRCHLRVMHRWRWTADLAADGAATFLWNDRPIAATLPRRRRRLRRLPPHGPPRPGPDAPDATGDPLPF